MFHYEEKLKDLKVGIRISKIAPLHTVTHYHIQCKEEIAIFTIMANRAISCTLIYQDKIKAVSKRDAHFIEVGVSENEKRKVWHFSTPDGPLPTLRCGMTDHIGDGTWSSTPHGFEWEPERGFEEVFLYMLDANHLYERRGPRAIQNYNGLWESGEQVHETKYVRNMDISAIPMGYHPIVGEPSTHVRYIWAYLAKKPEWEKLP